MMVERVDKIEYRNQIPGEKEMFELFETTGWNDYLRLTPAELHQAVGNSWDAVCARHGEKLVGFGRTISDGVLHALIVEMMVLPDYQGEGIGRRVLQELVGRCEEHGIRDVQLFCAAGKVGFYEKHGFERRPTDAPGMQRRFMPKD
jgi:GNAT superfamily N-acetyltransferase